MDVKFLIERAAYDDQNPLKMAKYAKEKGIEVIEVNYVPFGGGVVNKDEREFIEAKMPSDNSCVFFYGSINSARWLIKNKNWTPLVWADFDELRCQKYYAKLGKYLVQKEYAFMPVGEIYRRKEWVFKTFGVNGQVFIRPDDNAKSYPGEVVAEENWEKWYSSTQVYISDETNLSIVSKPVKITQEWRIVVANGKVITGSQYRIDGMVELEQGMPDDVIIWTEWMLAQTKYAPHPMFCVDVGMVDISIPNTGNRVWECMIVEVGSVNTCGLYECDINKIVDAAVPLAEKEWKELME